MPTRPATLPETSPLFARRRPTPGTKGAEKAELATPALPHKVRHSYATDMYENGIQLDAISALLVAVRGRK